MISWLREHEAIIVWLVTASGALFIATLIAVPIIVIRLPADYFAHGRREAPPWGEAHPVVHVILVVLKNAAGAVFVLVGLLMLLAPGQGLLTMVIGLVLLDFPGKYRLERWAMSHRFVLRPINWLRRRARRPPLTPWGEKGERPPCRGTEASRESRDDAAY